MWAYTYKKTRSHVDARVVGVVGGRRRAREARHGVGRGRRVVVVAVAAVVAGLGGRGGGEAGGLVARGVRGVAFAKSDVVAAIVFGLRSVPGPKVVSAAADARAALGAPSRPPSIKGPPSMPATRAS